MELDFDDMTTDELRMIHHHVSVVLSKRVAKKRAKDLAKFSIGDRVEFDGSCGHTVTGVVERVNRKTISIGTDNGPGYRVPPGILRHARKPVKAKNIFRPHLLKS